MDRQRLIPIRCQSCKRIVQSRSPVCSLTRSPLGKELTRIPASLVNFRNEAHQSGVSQNLLASTGQINGRGVPFQMDFCTNQPLNK